MKITFRGEEFDVNRASLADALRELEQDFEEAQMDVPYGTGREQRTANARSADFYQHLGFLREVIQYIPLGRE